MKNLLAAATIVAGLTLSPAALAAGSGPGGNGYQNTGSASAALQGYTTSGPDGDCATEQDTFLPNSSQSTGSASADLQGYTTRGGPTQVAVTQLASRASSGNIFNWGDAGIGAAGAIGAALIAIGVSLVALRRRGRLAV
jgi:hypothetical protein